MNSGRFPKEVEHKSSVGETLRKHLSKDGVYKFSGIRRPQEKEGGHCNEEDHILLMFAQSSCICGYGAATLEDYDWKWKKRFLNKEASGKIWSAHICEWLLWNEKGPVLCSEVS